MGVKRSTLTAALAALLVACGGTPDTPAAVETSEARVAVEATEAAATLEPTEPPAAARAEALTAAEAIEAMAEAGLPLGEVRDNSANCEALECESLVTSDYVSVYEWPSRDEAVANQGIGPGREVAVVANLVLHFGGDSDLWPFETRPYTDAVRSLSTD